MTYGLRISIVIALALSVRPLASQPQPCLLTACTEAQFIASVNAAIQPLLSETPGKPNIMAANLEYAETEFIPNFDISVLPAYVDGLEAAGVQRIDINPGYLSLSDSARHGQVRPVGAAYPAARSDAGDQPRGRH